jgi:hypothetical protein
MTKAPTLLGKFMGVSGIIHHNVYVKGNLLFDAQYSAGLRVIDITDPKNMTEIAFSRHSKSTAIFSGSWGAYPWFKSGMIVHGDFEVGIRIERLDATVSAKHPDPEDAKFSIAAMNNNVLNLQLTKAGPYELSIYSAKGRKMFNLPGKGESRLQTLSLGDAQLASGTYMIRIQQGSKVLTTPLLMRD